MAAAESEAFSPPARTDGPQLSAEEIANLEELGADTGALAAVTAEYEQVEGELELALRQRELLRSIEASVRDLPPEEQASVLSQVAQILKPSANSIEAKQIQKDIEFANELMEILADAVPLEPSEQAQLRPMAAHALNSARGEVAVALVFEKIPALFDDVIQGTVSLSNTEIVALATASESLALEVASRPALVGRLEALELMALLCDVEQAGAEAICAEAPQLEVLQPEHLAILKERNGAVADALFKLPHVRERIREALEGAEEHWRRVEILSKPPSA